MTVRSLPRPDAGEVDEHHAGTRGLGEEKLVWRQPFLKIGGDGKGLPEVPGEDNVYIAKAVPSAVTPTPATIRAGRRGTSAAKAAWARTRDWRIVDDFRYLDRR